MAKPASIDEASDTRELILAAALSAFAEKGFDGATTREISTRAGVNHGLIPYYFGGKPKLWRAAVDRAFARLEEGLQEVLRDPASGEGIGKTRLLIRRYVRFVAQNPEFVLIMHDEGKRKGPRTRWLIDRHVKPMYVGLKAMFEGFQARGQLPADIDPVHFHYILAGSVGLFFHQAEECKRISGIDPFDDEAVEAHARAVEYVILGPESEEEKR